MGIIKGFTFDGVNSLDYNIGITGSAVYNAPTRDVEMISIPGRDGEYALDHGRFNNIEITYPSGMGDNDQTNFAQRVSDLRNQLASRVGYKRLEDEYNPDEYRMAIYKSGLEVSPVQYSRAGQFDIAFDCKPQRFLKSGESAVSKANNSTINNPTLFDAHPLLQFNSNGSDGEIDLGDQQIKILSALIGNASLNLSASSATVSGYILADNVTIINTGIYNTGDTITFKGAGAKFEWRSNVTLDETTSGTSNANGLTASGRVSAKMCILILKATDITFSAGTSASIQKTIDLTLQPRGGTAQTKTVTLTISYNGSNRITVRWALQNFTNISLSSWVNMAEYEGEVDSTKNTLQGVDIYIDLDIGEAYSIDSSNNVVSLNNFVNLGGELPVLPPGNTTITYTNISNFKITPRWWKI